MASPANRNRILVTCRNPADPSIGVIEYYFKKRNYGVDCATSLNGALGFLSDGRVALVIVDAPFDESEKLLEHIKCLRRSSTVPVVQLMPSGTNPVPGFRVAADAELVQPFEFSDLFKAAEQQLKRSSSASGAILEQEVIFLLQTDERFLDRANEVAAKLFAETGMPESAQVQLCTAFREAVSNAAQHGNHFDRNLPVRVRYRLDPERIVIGVTDSGKGFDWRNFVNESRDAIAVRRERAAQGRRGGLGIMLMLKCVDEVRYNDSGNELTLVKLRAATRRSASGRFVNPAVASG